MLYCRWKRSNRHARKASSIFGGRVGSHSTAAQTTGHAGLNIGHKFQPLSSDRALGGRLPLGHRGLWSSLRSSDAGRLSIECNDGLFRFWSINVTDYPLKWEI